MANEATIGAEEKLSAMYGSDTFGIKTMEKYLSKSAFKKMLVTVQRGGKLDMSIADEVAQAMKVWVEGSYALHALVPTAFGCDCGEARLFCGAGWQGRDDL